MSEKDWELENIYYECVKSVTSYILRCHWYPNNNERGYIQRSWRDGRKPDELVKEFVNKYGNNILDTFTPTLEPVFTKAEIKLCFDALTLFIQSGEFEQEQSAEIEKLWHKLRWLYTYPHLQTPHANDLPKPEPPATS